MPKIVEDEFIFRTVIRIMAEKGYKGATTKQMAEASGVSEVTLFRKYGSKKELVKNAIFFIIDQSNLQFAARYTGDLEADLKRITRVYKNAVIEHGDFVSTLVMELQRDKELSELMDVPKKVFMSFGELIMRYQKERKLQKEHPLQSISTLLGSLMYTYLLGKSLPINELLEIDLDLHVDRFLNGRTL